MRQQVTVNFYIARKLLIRCRRNIEHLISVPDLYTRFILFGNVGNFILYQSGNKHFRSTGMFKGDTSQKLEICNNKVWKLLTLIALINTVLFQL